VNKKNKGLLGNESLLKNNNSGTVSKGNIKKLTEDV
jgi:hypothetical protein